MLMAKSAVIGAGASDIGRRLNRDPMALTLESCTRAIEDAGLKREDIDGVAAYPGNIVAPVGYGGPQISEVQDALRLSLNWSSSGLESTGQLGPLINAALAVQSGICNHVLCYCTTWESTAQGLASKSGVKPVGDRATGQFAFMLPFGAHSPANWTALYAQHYFDEFGTTREELAQIALTARANAGKNPKAVYRDPLTLDGYLAAKMISTPLSLYDCDVPVDGSIAVIVSRADAARKRPALEIESIGCAMRGRPSWVDFDDLSTMAMRDAGKMLWEKSTLKPSDVDVAELYDGFSIFTLFWLEALGFCKKGEAGAFIRDGKRIALDGALPLATGGGQLSAGRLNGYGLLHEACIQLWGDGGERQVKKQPKVGLVASGGGPFAGCLLLQRA